MQSYLLAISPGRYNSHVGLTEDKSKHVRKGPRRIVYDMELACLEQSVPYACSRSKGVLDAPTERNKRESITQAQHCSDYQDISSMNMFDALHVLPRSCICAALSKRPASGRDKPLRINAPAKVRGTLPGNDT